jgi:hypothetical protein
MEPAARRVTSQDCVFLAGMVALSVVPYVSGLGLYSDDWGFLSGLHNAPRSLGALYDAAIAEGLAARPAQALLLTVLFWCFGTEPFGYHLANTAILAGAAALFYLAMRKLGVSRLVALAVPLIFAVLPNYSTDRFWIAAFQANLAVLFFLLSLYADLRFVDAASPGRWAWKALGFAALLGSVLAYEVTGPLFLLNVVVVWMRARRQGARPSMAMTLALAANFVVLAAAIGYKLTVTDRTSLSGGFLFRVVRTARDATLVHFGGYGLALPAKAARVLRDYADALVLGISVLVGAVTFVYLLRAFRGEREEFAPPRRWVWHGVAGLVLFAFGYAVVLTTSDIGFDTTGINNRTAIAATTGVAWTFVAAIGWVTTWLRNEARRAQAFCALTALLAATGCLVTNGIATFWVQAAERQEVVIDAVRRAAPSLPPGTTVLLDGVCPYVGPSIVFETWWDAGGMLRLRYGDRSLTGDVIKANTEVTPGGVRTILYDDVIQTYPFSGRLRVVDVATGQLHTLDTIEAARRYFAESRAVAECPPGREGYGVRIF